ncbi:unnamed protein product [Ectocarpus sp. CCAP 1310/34]|nr:unnamed protein product [Ectocarpus sp. CCAP 1310/34]
MLKGGVSLDRHSEAIKEHVIAGNCPLSQSGRPSSRCGGDESLPTPLPSSHPPVFEFKRLNPLLLTVRCCMWSTRKAEHGLRLPQKRTRHLYDYRMHFELHVHQDAPHECRWTSTVKMWVWW